VFEDSEQGLETARRAGMSAIDVNRLDLDEQKGEVNIGDSLQMNAGLFGQYKRLCSPSIAAPTSERAINRTNTRSTSNYVARDGT
jgi:hypothetical protein